MIGLIKKRKYRVMIGQDNLNKQQLIQVQIIKATRMQKAHPLTMLEQQQLNNVLSTQVRNPKVEQTCVRYYCEFKKQQTSIQSQKIVLYLKCAYYLAEKSQWITDMNGKKVQNAGLSLNQLVRKHSLQDVMITLKEYSKRITIEDPQTVGSLLDLIKEISFLITFYSKFDKVLAKLQLKEVKNPYTQMLAEFVWLMYIEFRNKVLKRSLEIIDNTCMLAHALCFTLIYSWDYHQPGYFTKGDNNLTRLNSRKEVNARIHEKILECFLIKSIDYYKNIAERFEAYFAHLKKSGLFKMDPEKPNFLSPDLLPVNYKKLDAFYQKKLDYNYLDERVFFKERTSGVTPGNFTPFARQKMHLPGRKIGITDRGNAGSYMSHRIINYEALETHEQTHNDQPPAEIKFPKNIMQTPLATTTPLIQQTPYTTGIMMYNYVNELSSRLHKKFATRQVDQLVFELIDQVLREAIRDENLKSMEMKRNQVFSVYKLVAEDFGAVYPHEVQSSQIMKALLLVAIEVVFFVSNIDFSFDRLEEKFSLSSISLWRGVDFFLKFDRTMPVNIKVHLLDVEVEIISERLWRDSQNLANIQKFLSNEKFTSKQVEGVYEKLCKRLLHQIAFQTVQLAKNLCESRSEEQTISEVAFQTMKEVLLNHTYMLWQNHLDQIIMCTLFSIFRAYKMNVKFQSIRMTYLLCNEHLSDQKKVDMFTRISYQGDGEDDGKGDIIAFYNECYIVEMNLFVKNKCMNHPTNTNGTTNTRPPTQRALQSKDVNALLQSPISGILPKDINYGIKKLANQNNGKMIPQMKNATPRLLAYTESPLLKNDIVPMRNPIQSRKVINFDEAEQMLTGGTTVKKDAVNDTCKLYQENQQTSNFFNRKFATLKPTKQGSQTPLVAKSPSTLSPSNRQSPSPRLTNKQMVVKQPPTSQNIYYTKNYTHKGGLNMNR